MMTMFGKHALRRRGKGWVSKGTDSDSGQVGQSGGHPENAAAALRAKMKGDRIPGVGQALELGKVTGDIDIDLVVERSNPMGAAGSLLTGHTMAQRDRNGLPSAGCAEFATGASCCSGHHRLMISGGPSFAIVLRLSRKRLAYPVRASVQRNAAAEGRPVRCPRPGSTAHLCCPTAPPQHRPSRARQPRRCLRRPLRVSRTALWS